MDTVITYYLVGMVVFILYILGLVLFADAPLLENKLSGLAMVVLTLFYPVVVLCGVFQAIVNLTYKRDGEGE